MELTIKNYSNGTQTLVFDTQYVGNMHVKDNTFSEYCSKIMDNEELVNKEISLLTTWIISNTDKDVETDDYSNDTNAILYPLTHLLYLCKIASSMVDQGIYIEY